MPKCAGNDPLCPCQDGDACHYAGVDAWLCTAMILLRARIRKPRPLSTRELEAADMRERGLSIEQIARQMGIAKNSVWRIWPTPARSAAAAWYA